MNEAGGLLQSLQIDDKKRIVTKKGSVSHKTLYIITLGIKHFKVKPMVTELKCNCLKFCY